MNNMDFIKVSGTKIKKIEKEFSLKLCQKLGFYPYFEANFFLLKMIKLEKSFYFAPTKEYIK